MRKRNLATVLEIFVLTAGLALRPSAAYGESQCEKMTPAQLRHALDQELEALEGDHTDEEDGALDKDILAALKNGHVIDYKDLEQTMADDGTSVEAVVQHAVEEADEQDAQAEQGQGSPNWTPIARRGKASRADGATDTAQELVEKAAEARAAEAKPR